jgi:hypothetical protein
MAKPVYCIYCGQRIPMSAQNTPPGGVVHHTDLTDPTQSYDAHMPCRLAITEAQLWGRSKP